MKMSRLCFKLSSVIFKEMSSIKEEIFLLSSIKCVNELKQDMDTEHELSLWNIMIMKFIFSHCTLPFAYLGHHFHHCYCYMKLRNCSDHGIKWVLALHFVHLNNWSKLWFLAGKAKWSDHFHNCFPNFTLFVHSKKVYLHGWLWLK